MLKINLILRRKRKMEKEPPNRAGATSVIIDLNEVTFIDKILQRLLRVLVSEGAECLASGVYIKHVLEQLTSKGKSRTFDRPLRRFRGSCWGHWAPR